MLVLSRRTGDEIVMGHGEIRISVLEISGKRVQLGISAPTEVSIRRHEVHQRIVCEAVSETELQGPHALSPDATSAKASRRSPHVSPLGRRRRGRG